MENKRTPKLLLIGRKISKDNFSGAFRLAVATVTISGTVLVLRNIENITQNVNTPLDVLFFLVGYGFIAFVAIVFLFIVYSFIGDVVGKYLIWTFEEEKETPRRLFGVTNSLDDIQKNYSYKQLSISSIDLEKVEGCYIVISDLFAISDDGTKNKINIKTKEFAWSASNSGIVDNRLNLLRGCPINLSVARVNTKKNMAEIVGINDYNTKIEKGSYFLQSRIFGKDFSAKTFSFELIYDGKKSLEIKNISNVSTIEFFTIDVKSRIRLLFRPSFIAKRFRFLRR